MTAKAPIAIIGGGVIGGAWAARFLIHGFDVQFFDPDPEADRKLDEILDNARSAWRKLTPVPLPSEGTCRHVASVADAVNGARYAQESVPERLDIKQVVHAEIEAHAAPEMPIGSSTSGFKPSELQEGLAHPERVLVTHPFNPVYLLPLVEVVPSSQNAGPIIEGVEELLREIGMHPLRVRKEIDAHIADRLLEAVWREALWLVKDDIATTREIDDAIRYGFGLRWAHMGLFETYRIAGGEAGMRHFIAQFGPALTWPWTKLMDVPELTDDLIDKITAQSDEQSGNHEFRDLERIRDDNIVGVLQALKMKPWGAGETLARHEERLRARQQSPSIQDDPIDRPLSLHAATALPEWVDYNGHMTEHRYLQVFGDATDAFLLKIGLDAEMLASGHSLYTVETHIRHVSEVKVGERLRVETLVTGRDVKRVRLAHAMHAQDGRLVATAEHMMLSVDTNASAACPMPTSIAEAIDQIWSGHSQFERPEWVGSALRELR